MHCVESAPKRVERLIDRSENLGFISVRVLLEPASPGGAMNFVGLFVNREVS